MDAESDEDQTNSRVEPRCLVVGREDIDGYLAHELGPWHPLCFVFWIGGE